MRRLATLALLPLLVLGLWFAPPAHAQRALQQVLDLNRQGMDAYNNLEIEDAQRLLTQALQAADRGRVTGAPLARTRMNLGVVAIAGMGDNAAGLEHFREALRADPSVTLDPMTSTPDVQAVFALARREVETAGPTLPNEPGEPTEPSEPTDPAAAGALAHTPVTEQLERTAVPVYVEVPGDVLRVNLYYRAHGMREFRRVSMEDVGRGFGFEIPCDEVLAPSMAYYIVAIGRDGSPVGASGSQVEPHQVPIVAERSVGAPALPGRAPPEQCVEATECPPGMAGCETGGGGGGGGGGRQRLGDSCRSDAECQSGNCDDDICGPAEQGSGPSTPASGAPSFFVRLGGTLGLSYVTPGNGLPTDRQPCGNPLYEDAPNCVPQADVPGFDWARPEMWPQYGYEQYDRDLSQCMASGGDNPNCTARFFVAQGGFATNGAIRLDLGYYFNDIVALTVGARIQPASGRGALSFMLLNAGLEFQLTSPASEGFHLHAHARFNVGQIQVFLPREANSDAAAWGTSGLFGADVGLTAGYRFSRNFGLYLQPTAVVLFPSFLFTLDLTGGIEVGF